MAGAANRSKDAAIVAAKETAKVAKAPKNEGFDVIFTLCGGRANPENAR